MKKVLTIAGSDCSGGAGIQADIKTITVHKMYAMSVITALTAQNTTGVYAVHEAPPAFVGQQIDCVFRDIRPDAVKIGMVSNSAIIEVIAAKLREYGAECVVVDPVMVATSGSKLLSEEATSALRELLLPLATVITPNIPEAEVLCGGPVRCEADMMRAASEIGGRLPGAVLVKWGHLVSDASDYLFEGGAGRWYRTERIDNPNTHGTGCTLSSAIACRLAEGRPLGDAVSLAKEYLTGALRARLNLGAGSGPLDHVFLL